MEKLERFPEKYREEALKEIRKESTMNIISEEICERIQEILDGICT